ncbi:WXG100 family type VII secretion target [Mycobacteroides abscessus]|uniref:WXG100 family type VII secretion target n=1 Tax=Mycobacteroides abscessus TaxID=36809 RepID=UPI0019CFB4E4|nr:WXG100 family type VII secretion target [Mycobacteroides abscessus]MBN7559494.1 WXG100 family type VII secretion target [Mycobacteroides abscessus subsp. abscessus]
MEPDDATRYRVDLEALQAFIDQLAAFDRVAERRTAEVDRRINDLHTQWSGADAAAQLTNHQQWTDGMAEMRQAELALEEAASKALHNYRGVGEHNQRMWP